MKKLTAGLLKIVCLAALGMVEIAVLAAAVIAFVGGRG